MLIEIIKSYLFTYKSATGLRDNLCFDRSSNSLPTVTKSKPKTIRLPIYQLKKQAITEIVQQQALFGLLPPSTSPVLYT